MHLVMKNICGNFVANKQVREKQWNAEGGGANEAPAPGIQCHGGIQRVKLQDGNAVTRLFFWLHNNSFYTYYGIQGRNQLFISGGSNFHELSFDDVIVLIQPSQTVTDKVHFATFPKITTFQF